MNKTLIAITLALILGITGILFFAPHQHPEQVKKPLTLQEQNDKVYCDKSEEIIRNRYKEKVDEIVSCTKVGNDVTLALVMDDEFGDSNKVLIRVLFIPVRSSDYKLDEQGNRHILKENLSYDNLWILSTKTN